VITNVVHGWRPGGLIAYLFGPGRYEEHRNPRVVASWDGAPGFHQPDKLQSVMLNGEVLPPGEFDFDLGPLIATMAQLPKVGGWPLHTPPPIPSAAPDDPAGQQEVWIWSRWLRTAGRRRPPADAPAWVKLYRFDPKTNQIVLRPGYVWHCPVSLHPDDPVLPDAVWEVIAQRLMEATGIHQAGCRWIAVRHADNHIHLMATLVDEHGERFYPWNDYVNLRKAANKLEDELGLVPTAGIDKTARREPTRREIGKAQRLGRAEPARVELRRLVAQVAAAATNEAEFLAGLRAHGLVVHLQRGADGQIRGYAVGLASDRTAQGAPVLYAGGKLAADLTWPTLRTRWASIPARPEVVLDRTAGGHPTPAARRTALEEATTVVDAAAAALHAGEDGDGISHATGEVLATLSAIADPQQADALAVVQDTYDRAARTPHRVLPAQLGPLAAELRWTARRLARVGALSGRGHEKFATAALLLALAGLVAEIGAWQRARGRVHQAAAAHRTVAAIPTTAPAPVGARRLDRPAASVPRPETRRRERAHQGVTRPGRAPR
jgi:hypothetical protein